MHARDRSAPFKEYFQGLWSGRVESESVREQCSTRRHENISKSSNILARLSLS